MAINCLRTPGIITMVLSVSLQLARSIQGIVNAQNKSIKDTQYLLMQAKKDSGEDR